MVKPGAKPWTHKINCELNIPQIPNVSPEQLCDMVNSARPGPNFVNMQVSVHSSLNFDSWCKYRHAFEAQDPSLLAQLQWGFPVGADNPDSISVPFTNHKTAVNNPEIVQDYIVKHLATKAIYGPYDSNPLEVPVVVSPLQVAFSSSGKPRVCNDLSYGHISVNSCISSDWCEYPGYFGELELPCIDNVVQQILDKGKGCMLWKTDFSSYYKQISIDPGDLPLLGFAYDGKLYFEDRLPFGLRSSCLNAQRVTKAVIKIYNLLYKAYVAGYIDDCLGISLPDNALVEYTGFCDVTDDLGLLRTLPKCVAPCYCLVWIGVELDTMDMCMRLPCDKVDRMVQFLKEWITKNAASKRDVQVLLGVLNHAASILIVGRAFTGYMVDLLRSDHFPVPLPAEFFMDVHTWLEILQGGVTSQNTLKSPISIPCDFIIQVAFASNIFAVKVLDQTTIFEIVDQVDMCSSVAYTYAFWQASVMAAHKFPGSWITCTVLTVNDVHTINRARNVLPALRPMVRHTWCLQAKSDMVIRAKKGMCERDIDKMVRELNSGTPVSMESVPECFKV